jgi:hypothetical protein
MNPGSSAFLGGLIGSSMARTLCGVVAGLAILGGTAAVQADQNGRRERGAQVVQKQSQNHNQNQQRGRNDDRGSRGRGHVDRGRDDRHHDSGHGHGHRHGHNDHKRDTNISIHIGGTISHGHRPHVIYRPAPRPTYAQLEYERGFVDAKYAGFEAGKADALNWRPFCDSPNVCFDYVSSYYRSGYLAAYACAYKEGYVAGECNRQTVRLRHGSHSVRYRYSSSCRY